MARPSLYGVSSPDSTAIEGGNITLSPPAGSSGKLAIACVQLSVLGSGSPSAGTASRSGGWSGGTQKVATTATRAIRAYAWQRELDGTASDDLTATHADDASGTYSGFVLFGLMYVFDDHGATVSNFGTYGWTDEDSDLSGGSLTIAAANSAIAAFFAASDNDTWPTAVSFPSNVGTMAEINRQGASTGPDAMQAVWLGQAHTTGSSGNTAATMGGTKATSLILAEITATADATAESDPTLDLTADANLTAPIAGTSSSASANLIADADMSAVANWEDEATLSLPVDATASQAAIATVDLPITDEDVSVTASATGSQANLGAPVVGAGAAMYLYRLGRRGVRRKT